MEPLSALSLACGIVQMVDFSTIVVTRCRQLYKDGALSENNDVEEMATHLASLRDHLDLPDQRTPDELLELGKKCSDTAEDLIEELQKLRVKKPRKKREVARKFFKTLRKKEAIDGIWGRLCDYRKILNTHTLLDLRKRFDLSTLQQSKGFKKLHHDNQTIIALLAAGSTQVDELASAIRSENQSMKDHVCSEFHQHQSTLAYNDYVKRFLDSLWFPDIKRRQETIKEAHEETFQWIFETKETRMEARRWDDFVQWLETGQHTYWINGKAGSGKSTLMNYVYQDDRTHNSLKFWSGTKELCTPSFFFWNAGSDMEKSSGGLLRSLLHQVLQEHPKLTPLPDQITSKCHSAGYDLQKYGPIAAWTERRLQKDLHRVMGQLQQSCRLCIFIDGLDEYVGDGDALIETLKMLQSPELKLCLSSRPDRICSNAFGYCAKLKLQDLTEADIRVFVSDKLYPPLQAIPGNDCRIIFDTIVNKAGGVFLWVDLVVNEVLRGLQNGDSLDQSAKRLRLIPSDIEGMYAHMLSNIDEIYQTQAARLFSMALAGLTGSLLSVALALNEAFAQIFNVSTQDANNFCGLAKKRIPIICAGLLEVYVDDEEPDELWRADKYLDGLSLQLKEMTLYERSTYVNFIHRTSVDFLQKSAQGKKLMEEHCPLGWNPYVSHVRALLVKVNLFGSPGIPADTVVDSTFLAIPMAVEEDHRRFRYDIMENAALAEGCTGTAQVLLCEDIDRTLSIVHQQRSGRFRNDHWCVELSDHWIETFSTCLTTEGVNPRPCSRSSSAQSYHSTTSEQMDHDRLEWLSIRPVDMLGLASSFGLYHYVCHTLDAERDLNDQETATHLLCCSIWALHYRSTEWFWSKGVSIIRGSMRLSCELLRRGANPNFYLDSFMTTIWGKFLLHLVDWTHKFLPRFEKILQVFVDHGANVHEVVYSAQPVSIAGIKSLKGPMELSKSKIHDLRFRHEESALYIMRGSFDRTPEFEDVENACLSQGAHSFSRVTHIALKDEDDMTYQQYKVTGIQYSRFVAAVSGYKDQDIESIHLRLKYARKIAKVWREITNNFEEVDRQDYSDEEVTSDSTESYYSTSSRASLARWGTRAKTR